MKRRLWLAAAQGVEPIVAAWTAVAHAAKRATQRVPIVLYAPADAVATGLVASLAAPGGNITGVSSNLVGLVPKQMQLLREVVPGLQGVTFLGFTDDVATKPFVAQAQYGARAWGLRLQPVLISQQRDFEAAADSMQRERAQGVVVHPLFVLSQIAPLAAMLQQQQLRASSGLRPFAVGGGLRISGPRRDDQIRRAASIIDRVLKGARPDTLPVEEPTIFELLFNLRTASALGLNIPRQVLLRALEVIE